MSSGADFTADGTGRALFFGNNVQVNSGVHLDHSGMLSIGNHTLISEGALIYTHDHGLDPRSSPTLCDKTIGENVWIGARSIIMASCTEIGKGAVIAAGSVVTRNIPAGAVVAGIPAKILYIRSERAKNHLTKEI
ncbi:acyltransferase [Thioclava sp. F1Mire-8]|uniref:acyltransferase n=1 Tax=Thioclava sp. F1Mire-8 TaxID=1973006 RepID=UPI00143C61AB|nr:acyltransferase [Thioclava sp. F1Mire-8]